MMLSAARIARRLDLSGFFGLDFMIEEGSGDMYLIEMNPRCTPPCHLSLGKGRDMSEALRAQLSGQPPRETAPITQNDMIAYFPEAWHCRSEFLQSSFHDVPSGEPDLIEALLRPWPNRNILYRLYARLWTSTFQPKSIETPCTRRPQ
jgi:carbamoylphosphate synthase large subunit